MSRHDARVRLQHMLDYSREAVQLTGEKCREDLARERVLQLALARVVEIIGEAASQVSPDARQRYATIPWPQIIGMRNRVIHGYENVSLNILWDTVVDDLPPLIAALESILEPPAATGT